ncbi:AlpA family transcriptional regulator [Shewanella sp. NIFS-20-20]|uniref:helix-turn-helix transcriptional regulator n=1 Tax=Shewanella sp. NIFS-20-20 TaxID=2853806 RepID=UPI001C46B19A|nr:helix-turn-helix domain-containing protein [Shewanella sp. NIFS-20-20]MBV7317348.1 AlpA family phage regulatory protein [Shewanella sp. NIFS-20-20]
MHSQFAIKAKPQTDMVLPTLVSISEVCSLLSISRTTLYRRVKANVLPHPVMRNNRTLGWRPDQLMHLRPDKHRG